MNVFRLSLCLVFALSCKSKKDSAPAEAPVAASKKDASAPAVSIDKEVEPIVPTAVGHRDEIAQGFSKAGLKLGPAPLADWDLETEEDQFLGFSKDGLQYAISTSIGHPEEPGDAPFYVIFIEVRDIYTQKATSVFQGDPFSDPNWGRDVRPYGKAEKQAAKRWKTLPDKALADKHLESVGIAYPPASLEGPGGQKLNVDIIGTAPFKSKLKLRLNKPKSGYYFKWTGFKDEPPDGKPGRSPKFEVTMEREAVSSVLLSLRSQYSYETIWGSADMDEPYLEGGVWAHWAPDGKRVNVVFDEQVHNIHEEIGYLGRTAQYLRAVGPQIKIIDAGVGSETARQAAALLDAHSLHVTRVETSKKPSTGAVLHYRGEAGKSAADAAAKLIPSATLEEIQQDGWIDLIVVLGT